MAILNSCYLSQVGPLIDETGTMATGKLTFSPVAWEQLLGRTVEELINSSVEVLKYLEHRLLFLRVTLLVGWTAEESDGIGRLCVLSVMM